MARSEARLAVTIWDDPDFLGLSPTAQRLFMFLVSQPDLAHDGVIALRERRWSKKARGLTVAQISADLDELSTARFVTVDDESEELLIRSFIRRDKVYRQPNVLRAALDHMAIVASPAILTAIAGELDRISAGGDVPEPSGPLLDQMKAIARKGIGNPSRKGSGNPLSPDSTSPAVNGRTVAAGDAPSDARADVSAGDKGSGNPSPNPSGNPTAGPPGERGVVTAVTTASPIPGPRASDPRPHSSSGARAGARDAASPTRTERPPDRCPDHIDDPDPPDCGRCAGARKAAERWDRDEAAAAKAAAVADAARQSAAAREQAAVRRAAIDACDQCDPDGRLSGGALCHHDPRAPDRARRGAAVARAQIRRSPKGAT